MYPHKACDFIGLCSAILLCSTDSVSFLLNEKSPSTLTYCEKHLSTTTKHIHTRAQTPNSPTSPPSQSTDPIQTLYPLKKQDNSCPAYGSTSPTFLPSFRAVRPPNPSMQSPKKKKEGGLGAWFAVDTITRPRSTMKISGSCPRIRGSENDFRR